MSVAGCLQGAGPVQTCCRVILPQKGSTARCGRGLPHRGLTRTGLRLLRLKCNLVPQWHNCWFRRGCSFLCPCRGFLCAAKGWSRHRGRRELWRESRDRGHNLGHGHKHAGLGLEVRGTKGEEKGIKAQISVFTVCIIKKIYLHYPRFKRSVPNLFCALALKKTLI